MSDAVYDPAADSTNMGVAGPLPPINNDKDQVSVPQGGKEGEAAAFAEEAKIVAEIKTTAEALDRQALSEVQKAVQEAKQARPEPVIPPDVEDAGVVNPTQEAEKVVSDGSTIEIPYSEEIYKKGQSIKVGGHSTDRAIIGVSSIVALAIWIKRMIKKAHKHAKKVVFRKGGQGAD